MAETRQVTVRIKAEIASFKADMAAAAKAAEDTAKKTEQAGSKAQSGIGKLSQVANTHEKAWGQVSTGLIAGGVAVVGGLTMATKAAMTWESAWTGVLKTVDGSPAQLGRVEDGLRGLAKTLPSTHTEIAAVAEAAGQLGIKTDDVVGFTKVMIDLGQSTNLTAEEGATSLARFMNVMGTSADDVGRLGATLVGLGNNYATTESEIMGMSMRLSGASRQIGLSEGETMGLAAAMSSVGIEAEAGGSAMSLTMKRIGKAVDEGDGALATFAETAGMTAEQFATLWKEDAAGGLDAFVVGLGEAGEAGESVNGILTDLGITGIRESDALLRLSSAGSLLGDGMMQGAKEYESGMALIEEANKRYETAESKIRIAWNNITDAAIDAGAVILPVVAALAESVGKVVSVFGDLPAPMQTFLVAATALVGVAALVAGGLMKVSVNAMSTITGLRGLAAASPGAAAGLGKVAKAAGALAILATVGPTIAAMVPSGTVEEANKVSEAILAIGSGGEKAAEGVAGLNEMFTGKGNFFDGLNVKGIEDAFKILGNRGVADNIDLIVSKTLSLGTRGSSNIEFAKKNFEQLDAQLAQAATSGNAESAAKTYDMIADSAKNAGVEQSILTEHFPEYAKALEQTASETEKVATESALMGAAMGVAFPVTKDMAEGLAEIGVAADGSITAIDRLLATLWQLSDGTLDVRAANRAVEDSYRTMEESIKKNGKSLDETTAKGSANQANLDAYIGTLKQRTTAIATAVDENGELVHSDDEVQESMTKSYEQAIKAAGEFGIFGKEAQGLARELLGIPKDVTIETWLEDFATDRANQITGALDAMPERKDIKVMVTDDGTANLTQAQIDAILGQTAFVEVTDEGTVLHTQGAIDGVTDGDAQILVSDDGTITVVQGGIDGINNGSATVNVTDGGTVASVQHLINNIADGYAKIRVTLGGDGASHVSTGRGGRGGLTSGGYTGGIVGELVNGLAGGGLVPGRVPLNSLGDNVLATVGGKPFGLRSGEMVVNEQATRENYPLLKAINDGATVSLPGFAGGGRVGAAEKKVSSTKRAYDRISGDKANRLRKLAAKDQYDAAKAELAAVKKSSKASADAAKKAADARKKAAEEEQARQGRLSDSRRDLRTDIRRGDIVDSFTSGSGLSQIDKLGDASRNKDYSASKRRGLDRDANALEKSLTILTKKSEGLKTALEAATDQASELRSVRDSVAGGLRGEFSLSGMLSTTRQDLGAKPFTAKGISGAANKMARRIEIFAGRLNRLRKMGYGETIIQEVAGLGTEDGITVAGVLMNATQGEKSSIVGAYKRLDAASGQAGQYVTESMYKGGLDAADGLVNGLKSKTKTVENAFYKLGKDTEKAFKRSLGIKSPSTVMFGAGVNVGEGAELGILSKVGDVQGAMGLMAEAPAFSVPPSAEVARYAAQPAAQQSVQQGITPDQLRSALSGMDIRLNTEAGTVMAKLVNKGVHEATRGQVSIYQK